MKPRIIHGNVLDVAPKLPDRSVQCMVTSPPYWAQRDYGTHRQIWKSNQPLCRTHRWSEKNFCEWCNAWRGELGNEPTPDLYVQHMVEIFRELRRILRQDGVLWLNLGDTYSKMSLPAKSTLKPRAPANFRFPGLKKKDLVGIPWAVAFALRDDGWYLRSDIIWHKPNAMVESIKDRPTKAHEYIFLLTRSEKYFYDVDAIREPHKSESVKRGPREYIHFGNNTKGVVRNKSMQNHPLGRNKRTVWTISTKNAGVKHHAIFPEEIPTVCIKAGSRAGDVIMDPFAGSATTGVAATKLGRIPWLIELSGKYIRTIIKPRLKKAKMEVDRWMIPSGTKKDQQIGTRSAQLAPQRG